MRRKMLPVVLLCGLLLLAATAASAGGGKPTPLTILKGPYLQNVTTSTITVMWQTSAASDSRVDFGPDSGYGNYVYSATPVTMHEVHLAGLATDSLYHYLVTSHTSTQTVSSADSTFQTAVAPATPFRFAAYGDSRSYPVDHAAVCSAIIADAPRFVAHTGDLTINGRKDGYWQTEFFNPAQPMISTITFFPVLGNHEWNSNYYYQYYDPPDGGGTSNEEWYSFNFGDAHCVVIDTQASFSPGSTQYNWLVNDLQSATSPWLFVFQHYPAYSSGNHGGDGSVQSYLVPLYEQYSVDMVFQGHDHIYERSVKSGVQYVVTGGGGAELYTINMTPNPYQVYAEASYHHCTVDVSGNQATLRAVHNDGSVFDTVTLTHP